MDHIKKFLSQTGWSCDQLLQKLNEYKKSSPIAESNLLDPELTLNNGEENNENFQQIQTTPVFMEIDASDHNYTKKVYVEADNNEDDTQCKITDVCTKKKSRRSSFRNSFFYRIKQSYKRRRRCINIARSRLIPRGCQTNSEGVRNKILLQLELLRTKRSSEFGRNITAEPVLYKKRFLNETVKEENLQMHQFDINKFDNNADLIFDVKSDLEIEASYVSTNINNELNSYTIKPTKTKDITKIKGWKNKKFLSVVKFDTDNFVHVDPEPSCSYKENSISEQLIHISNDNKISVNDCVNDREISTEISQSPFASNNLDGFLHDESANLHISFQIPKLASGEDSINIAPTLTKRNVIRENNIACESEILNGDSEHLLKIHKITNLYQPRTVAQRRRIWRLKDDAKTIKQDEVSRKPRTLAEKRRLLDVNDELKKQNASDTSFVNENLNYSYVQYRSKKLKVPTATTNGIIAYVKYSHVRKDYIYVAKRQKLSPSKTKPSIFNTINNIKSEAIKYRPGPLCRKLELQQENKNWKTVIKKLPKVFLEITPRIGKPIHPRLLHLLPNYKFDLSDERIEFALSVLRYKNETNNNTFSFRLPYANAEESMLFRSKLKVEEMGDILQENELNMMDVVADVVKKMLDYVETKDVADDIFKEDLNARCRDDEKSLIKTPVKLNIKKKVRKSKTNYELRRLNVKVIEVDLEDKGDIIDCNKDHCKLGCVCNSLATTSSLVSNHCGIPECMFECNCNYNRKSKGNLKVTLPIGMDVLSEGAVSRLEVEAKKNLAKVEKEFTQTVIQANNQTIIVGGHSNRQRRLTKTPRKYNDFIDDPDCILQSETDVEEIVEPKLNNNKILEIEWKPCVVNVTRLKLEQVIPFCLVHNLHNCYCNYKAPYVKVEDKIKKCNIENILKQLNDDHIPKQLNTYSQCTSARTRGISTSYYLIRNRTREYISTRTKKFDKLYREYLEKIYDEEEYSEIDDDGKKENEKKKEPVEEQPKLFVNSDMTNRKDRRKQQLTVRDDAVILPQTVKNIPSKKTKVIAMNKHKKYTKRQKKMLRKAKLLHIRSPVTTKKVEIDSENVKSELNNVIRDDTLPKFDDLVLSMKPSNELLTPSSAVRTKFLQLLGKRNECDAQFRLMLWSGLANRYETNKLQLWYSSFFKVPKIIATTRDIVPRHFTNIKQFESVHDKSSIKVDMIRWLVTKMVPGGKRSDDVLVILQLTKTYCELCGICEKTYINSQFSDNMLLSLIPSSVTQSNNSNIENKDNMINDEKIISFETVDDQKKQHIIATKIMFSKYKYPRRVLYESNDIDSSLLQHTTSKQSIYANLPYINENCMWRMILLNSDFSILSLLRNNYAIKYSDLLRIVKMSQATSTTVVIKTDEVDVNYCHPDFGIYASPDFDEKIIIGPYFHNESHDISTLRYVNRELVKTEIFNQMKGKAPTNSGIWLRQMQEKQTEKKNLQTIDLTAGESDNETEFIETQEEETSSRYSQSPRSLLKLNVCKSASNFDDKDIAENITKNVKHFTERNIFTSDDIVNFEMCAIDFETVDYSSDSNIEDDSNVDIRTFENQMYFMSNVPFMGYILAHRLKHITIVRWPSLNNAKRFPKIEDAVTWLERELSQYFIVPPNFKIRIKLKMELTPSVDEPFDPKYLKGYYIATKYGVWSLLNLNANNLRLLDMSSEELETLARNRAKKMIYDKCCDVAKEFVPLETLKMQSCSKVIDLITSEVKRHRMVEDDYIVKRRKLLHRRKVLMNNLSSVIEELSPHVSVKLQVAMREIYRRHKLPGDDDVVCIPSDSDEEIAKNVQPNIETQVTEPAMSVIPKITVRSLHDLTDPNLTRTSDEIILTKKRTCDVPQAIRLKNIGSLVNQDVSTSVKPASVLKGKETVSLSQRGNNKYVKKHEQIYVSPASRPPNNIPSSVRKSSSTSALPTNTIKKTFAMPAHSKESVRRHRPILPPFSKYVIRTPSGKLIRVNADQIKGLQKKSSILGNLLQPNNMQSNGLVVLKKRPAEPDGIEAESPEVAANVIEISDE